MKAVIFDFDGTLTTSRYNLWKDIWRRLGYDVGEGSYYKSLLHSFMDNKITHSEWCVLTCQAYQDKGFNQEIFYDMVSGISLMNGAVELFKYLTSKGIELHIVSGNILDAIEAVLGDNIDYFLEIKANDFIFDENGKIKEIIGTKYDHEGKATYIKQLCEDKNYDPSEVVFVGNSMNDEWVYQSGARTICINPDETDIGNSTIWNKVIYTDNLMDIAKEFYKE